MISQLCRWRKLVPSRAAWCEPCKKQSRDVGLRASPDRERSFRHMAITDFAASRSSISPSRTQVSESRSRHMRATRGTRCVGWVTVANEGRARGAGSVRARRGRLPGRRPCDRRDGGADRRIRARPRASRAAAASRRLHRLDPADALGAGATLAAIEAGKTWRELEAAR